MATQTLETHLVNAVKGAISKQIEEEYQKTLEEAKKRIEKNLSKIVASISLDVMRHISIYSREFVLI